MQRIETERKWAALYVRSQRWRLLNVVLDLRHVLDIACLPAWDCACCRGDLAKQNVKLVCEKDHETFWIGDEVLDFQVHNS